MTPSLIVAEIIGKGGKIQVEGDHLRLIAPKKILSSALLAAISRSKQEILHALSTGFLSTGFPTSTKSRIDPPPTGPLAPAHYLYREAIAEIAEIWDAQASAGLEPPRLPPAVESRLDERIAARFRANDLRGALAAIEAWRKAWRDLLAPFCGLRIPADRLIPLAGDPSVPESRRRAYRVEVLRRAQAILDEADGRRPHPNQGVHDMFDRDAGKGCHGHRHWRSLAGVVICGVCHPPAHPRLVAEWIEEGGDATE